MDFDSIMMILEDKGGLKSVLQNSLPVAKVYLPVDEKFGNL